MLMEDAGVGMLMLTVQQVRVQNSLHAGNCRVFKSVCLGNLCKKSRCILKGVFCSVRGDCVQSSKGLGCYSGKCGCKGSADCERGGVCKEGRCRSKPSQSCENNGQCQFAQDGTVCTRGTCGCFNDNDCPNAGSLCNQGRCSQGFGGPGGPPPELLGLGGPGGPGGPPPGGPGGPGNNPFGK